MFDVGKKFDKEEVELLKYYFEFWMDVMKLKLVEKFLLEEFVVGICK